ncbi:MAG: hypothetical protein KatS3mg028_0153 [Bacteroidia bacterium]|nr:MAG: hypothetical protein KatS3mg028_0153 [Bacteroidia bacterium]
MRIDILSTVVILSILHGAIPSHWLPAMTLKKQYRWNVSYTFKIVSVLSIAHILSTIIIGILVAAAGKLLSSFFFNENAVRWVSSLSLFILGGYFIYRHYYHHHFHLSHEDDVMRQKEVHKQLRLLITGMFFSPCLEITGMYWVGGMIKWQYVVLISAIYFFISFLSSVFWIFFFDGLSKKLNFHKIEHYGGLLSGVSLIVSAGLMYVV